MVQRKDYLRETRARIRYRRLPDLRVACSDFAMPCRLSRRYSCSRCGGSCRLQLGQLERQLLAHEIAFDSARLRANSNVLHFSQSPPARHGKALGLTAA